MSCLENLPLGGGAMAWNVLSAEIFRGDIRNGFVSNPPTLQYTGTSPVFLHKDGFRVVQYVPGPAAAATLEDLNTGCNPGPAFCTDLNIRWKKNLKDKHHQLIAAI